MARAGFQTVLLPVKCKVEEKTQLFPDAVSQAQP